MKYRLTESRLRGMIREAVKSILKEYSGFNFFEYMNRDEGEEIDFGDHTFSCVFDSYVDEEGNEVENEYDDNFFAYCYEVTVCTKNGCKSAYALQEEGDFQSYTIAEKYEQLCRRMGVKPVDISNDAPYKQ